MTAPLAGLAVVVTRPARQNDTLVSQLQVLGADVAAIPLLAIEPLTEPAQLALIDQRLAALRSCQFAIFISQNAAEQALQALAQRGLPWPATLPAFAVGSATAAMLQQHGIPANSPTRMDSEGLLALPALQHVTGQRGVIFRGQGGRETLACTLRDRGATVDYCELYRRSLPPAAAGQWLGWLATRATHQPALVCINSSESLRHLLAIDDCVVARDNLTLLVPGERVARAAAEAGFTQICSAQDATDSATITTALHWYPS